MSNPQTRRKFIKTALGTAAAAGVGGTAVLLARRYGLVPPDHGGLYGVGETLTYATQRLLISRASLAREFSRDRVSKNFPPFGTVMPEDQNYMYSMIDGFQSWRLLI